MSSAKPIEHLDLVRAAILAPSPDNNQPWRFVSRQGRLEVRLDASQALPSDVNAMCDLTGLGAGVENACIAARAAGCDLEVQCGGNELGAVASGEVAAATMTVIPGGTADPLVPYMAMRCTCRKGFSTRPVEQATLDRLTEAASRFRQVQVDWIVDRPRIRCFARLVAASDLLRFQYEPFHNEIFRQLRFSPEEAQRTRDGLDLRSLELPPGTGFLLRQLRPWKRMQWLHRLGIGRLLTVPSLFSVIASGALGVLSVPAASPELFVEGGRALQRIWLAATAEKLALHPLGSLSVFLAHGQQLHGAKLRPKHQQNVRRLAARLRELLPAVDSRVVQLAFRIGAGAAPSVRSLRRPAEDVYVAEVPPGSASGSVCQEALPC